VSDLPDRLRHIAPIHEGRRDHDCIAEAAVEIDDLYVMVRTQIIEIYDLRTEIERLNRRVDELCSERDLWEKEARRG
jgi:hypothetical protein